MPNFQLSEEEAQRLAAFLTSRAEPATEASTPADAGTIERGKQLVQTSGCLNCHVAPLENQFKAKPLTALPTDAWDQGCLAAQPRDDAKAPFFDFTNEKRAALQAFAATDRASLSRHVPAEFAQRELRSLNCRECHGQFEGFPPVDDLGGKLKPEWLQSFIGGEVPYKPRPWLEARMPSFPAYGKWLGEGMAEAHGFSPQTPEESPLDQEAVVIGQRLVSMNGGFGCIACHAVGKVAATLVFESAGINLAHSGARLQRPYFERWMRNPIAIDPLTKMPAYFTPEGTSPLTDVCEGNALMQIDAIWQYLRMGEKMPPPPGTTPAP